MRCLTLWQYRCKHTLVVNRTSATTTTAAATTTTAAATTTTAASVTTTTAANSSVYDLEHDISHSPGSKSLTVATSDGTAKIKLSYNHTSNFGTYKDIDKYDAKLSGYTEFTYTVSEIAADKAYEFDITLDSGVTQGTLKVQVKCGTLWQYICAVFVSVTNSSVTTTTTTTTTTAAPSVSTYVTIKFADTYGVGGEDVTISNLCVTNSTNSNGADVNLQTCDGGDDQKWEAVSFGTGTQYKNKSTSKCIDNRGNAFGKKQINVWSCIASTHGAAPNQRFTIDSSGYVKSANGYWLIDNSTLNGNGTSSTKMKFSTS